MDNLQQVFMVLAPVVAAIVLGVVARTTGVVQDSGVAGIKGVVMNFCLPATLFGALYKTVFNADVVIVIIAMVLANLAGFFLGVLLHRLFPSTSGMLPFVTCVFESGMLGFGLYLMLFPAEYLYNMAILDLGQAFFVYTFFMAVLNGRKGLTVGQSLKAQLKMPIVYVLALGVIFGANGLGRMLEPTYAGALLDGVLGYISAPTGMLMVFVVGYGLVLNKKDIKNALFAVLSRALIMAALCAAMLLVLGRIISLSEPMRWAIVLMFSLPASYLMPVLNEKPEEAGFISTTLSFGTLLAIAVFAVISFIR